VYCGQTVGWIKMPLGTEIGLGPGDIVSDGDPAPPPLQKGAQQPHHFSHVYYACQTVAHLCNCWALVKSVFNAQRYASAVDTPSRPAVSVCPTCPYFTKHHQANHAAW